MLDQAIPALDDSMNSLNCVSKNDIWMMKAIAVPTPLIVKGMECACIMLNVKPKKNVPL